MHICISLLQFDCLTLVNITFYLITNIGYTTEKGYVFVHIVYCWI